MIQRKLLPILLEMLENFRVVAINGPRQSGKTTLQKEIAKLKGYTYYTFDNQETHDTAQNDPQGFISFVSKQKVALDEVQMVPEVVPSIKICVDDKNEKGMFLLTGSSDMFKNTKIKESLAGRMVNFNLFPLSYSEINNRDINIIDKLFSEDFNSFDTNFETIENDIFIDAVINGGYPEVYTLSKRAKKSWFEFYIKARITKDIASIDNVELDKIASLDTLLKVLAAHIGKLVNYKSISNDIGLADKTVAKYIQILEALYIVKLVPAYSNNMLKRVVKSPKVHFIDSGLASFLLNIDKEGAMTKQGDVYGDLVESFVYSELLKHQTYANESINIFHYRDQQKKEVDFILESTTGRVVALEVKSGSRIKNEYFKGLLAMAQSMKNKPFVGIILYGGDKVLPQKVDGFTFWAIPLKVLV